MSKKPAPKRALEPDDPDQSKRFIDTAKEIGADENSKAFEKALAKIVTVRPPRPKS